MFKKELVIDARGHLLGRLASVVAKELLAGQSVTVVRCEGLNVSGSLRRNKLILADAMNKCTRSNPKRGPFHYSAPCMMLWRTIRGMLPRKTARGQIALHRLKTFDGIPFEYEKSKRMVIPQALRVMRLKPTRKFVILGELAQHAGWKQRDLLARLTKNKTERIAAGAKALKATNKLRAQARKNVEERFKEDQKVLAPLAM